MPVLTDGCGNRCTRHSPVRARWWTFGRKYCRHGPCRGCEPGPDALAVPYSGDVEVESRLMRAAMPVVDRLSSDLAGTETALVVSDNQGTVVHRRVFSRGLGPKLDRVLLAPGFSFGEEHVGTNGIGTRWRSAKRYGRGGRAFRRRFCRHRLARAHRSPTRITAN